MNFIDTESTPTTTPKSQSVQPLSLNIVISTRGTQLQNLVSPHGSDLSFQSQAFYSKPSAFITPKDIDQIINDIIKNIKQINNDIQCNYFIQLQNQIDMNIYGKYHRSITRMHKLLGYNSNIPFVPYQQIKLYRRYFECMRKLTKRYFSQIGMTKNQLINLEKMCERGTYILDNWYDVLCDLIKQKSQILIDDEDEDDKKNLANKTNHTLSSERNLDQQSDRKLNTETVPLTRRGSLNRIKEVEEEESESNSVNGSFKQIQESPCHQDKEAAYQQKMQRRNEKQQNQKILQNKIRFILKLHYYLQKDFQKKQIISVILYLQFIFYIINLYPFFLLIQQCS